MKYLGIQEVYTALSYLEHYGVLGMKWGIRKEKPRAQHLVRTSTHGMLGEKDPEISKTAVETNQKTTNPFYKWDSIYKINCAYCSMAFNLRLRGYSVEAMPAIYGGLTTEEEVKCFTNIYTGESPKVNNSEDIFFPFSEDKKERSKILKKYNIGDDYFGLLTYKRSKEERIGISKYISDSCKSFGEGSSGTFNVNWITGGGHSMAWVVENGEFKVIDSQTGDIYTEENLADLLEYVTMFNFIRLDDCEPNANILKYIKASDKNIHAPDMLGFKTKDLPDGGSETRFIGIRFNEDGEKEEIEIPNKNTHELFKKKKASKRGDS